jgi:uncharacterized membrane protein SpoIIM required for sporulation
VAGLFDLSMRRSDEQAAWSELEALLARLEQKGERHLTVVELDRMGALYRRAAARLAEARRIEFDRARQRYLDDLVRRAHFAIYQPPKRGLGPLVHLVMGGFAVAFRRTLSLQAIAFGLFLLGGVMAYAATRSHVELAYPLLSMMFPAEVVQALIESEEARRAYITSGQVLGLTGLSAFALALVANNTRVALMSFALGIAGGVPTVLVTLMNGALLGSMAALYDRRGVDPAFWAWVLPHGIPEIAALSVAAAGGLSLGRALLAPGDRPRGEVLVRAGKQAAVLLGLAILLLIYAGMIEGYFRQFQMGSVPRYLLALFNLVALSAYLSLAGRGVAAGERRYPTAGD